MNSKPRFGIGLLPVPFDLGASRSGAADAPEALLSAGLEPVLAGLGYAVRVHEPIVAPKTEAPLLVEENLRFLEEAVAVNRLLADKVAEIAGQGDFPLVLGGDHSIAIGTLAGLSRKRRSLGVVWFDAHSDLNTPDTSPSGNIHGMSLAVGIGRGHPLLTAIRGGHPPVKPDNVVLIGVRSLDAGEKAFIRESGIACYTMQDIDRKGISRVVEETVAKLAASTDGVHLSFDVDSVDPLIAPGTGTPVGGGVTSREAHFALELLCESGLITSAEFVEVNPSLDRGNQTSLLAVELISSLLGDTIL